MEMIYFGGTMVQVPLSSDYAHAVMAVAA